MLARHLLGGVDPVVVGDDAAEDLVLAGDVAVAALQVVTAAHVHVQRAARKVQALVEVAVLDAVAAAAVEVALAAVLARGRAHAPRGGEQIDLVGRVAELALAVGRGVGVAGQAIDVLGIGLLRRLAGLPAVAGMA